MSASVNSTESKDEPKEEPLSATGLMEPSTEALKRPAAAVEDHVRQLLHNKPAAASVEEDLGSASKRSAGGRAGSKLQESTTRAAAAKRAAAGRTSRATSKLTAPKARAAAKSAWRRTLPDKCTDKRLSLIHI